MRIIAVPSIRGCGVIIAGRAVLAAGDFVLIAYSIFVAVQQTTTVTIVTSIRIGATAVVVRGSSCVVTSG